MRLESIKQGFARSMTSSRLIVLLGAICAGLGCFFPLYTPGTLPDYLTEGPLIRAIHASQEFAHLIQLSAVSRQKTAFGLFIIPAISHVLYWFVFLLALFSVGLVLWVYQQNSAVSRRRFIVVGAMGLIALCLVLLSHTFSMVEIVLGYQGRRTQITPSLWDVLQSVSGPVFWISMKNLLRETNLEFWFPFLGFTAILLMSSIMKIASKKPRIEPFE